jgi:hypothetical protein
MNKSQERAINAIRRHIEDSLNTNPDYGDEITRWEVTTTSYGCLWVTAENEMTKLPETNLLRIIDRQYWLFAIGKRGAITMKMGPNSYKQFNGRKAFGFHVDTK